MTRFKSLKLNESLGVCRYDLEVMNVVDTQDYLSGRCFISTASADTKVSAAKPSMKRKSSSTIGISKQLKSGDSRKSASQPVNRHDPNAENAVVLYTPPNEMTEVEMHVVVDPAIASSLRVHQKQAVQFMYSCGKCMTTHVLSLKR